MLINQRLYIPPEDSMHRVRLFAFTTTIFTLLQLLALTSTATQKTIDAEFIGYKPQIVIGESAEFKVYAENLTIQSAEVSPPEGITIQDIKEIGPDPKYAATQKKGVKTWAIRISADLSAKPGERSITLVSPKGRSKPQTIRVTSHVPKISDLKVISTSSTNVEIDVEFAAFDETGDIKPDELPSYLVMLQCGQNGLFIASTAKKVTLTDKRNSIVQVTSSHFNSTASGNCLFRIRITDKEGNESNDLETTVTFKR